MKNERYYYSTLTDEEKAAYRMICGGLRQRMYSIPVTVCLTFEQLHNVYTKVLYDNPLFYYATHKAAIRMSGGNRGYVLTPEYLYTDAEIGLINRDIRNILHKIDVKAHTMLSDGYRLEKYLHDSIVKTVAYDYDSLQKRDRSSAHSIVGVFLDKKAVCEGISKAFKLLCNKYSIKCIVVFGEADQDGSFTGNINHAWNLVKVENGSYHVDVTWDNMFGLPKRYIGYDYFNVTTNDILRDHHPMCPLPMCTSVELNYFTRTGSVVRTYDELLELIKRRFNSRAVMFKIPAGSEFGTMDEVKDKTQRALQQVTRSMGSSKKSIMSFNEQQWIGKILFQ